MDGIWGGDDWYIWYTNPIKQSAFEHYMNLRFGCIPDFEKLLASQDKPLTTPSEMPAALRQRITVTDELLAQWFLEEWIRDFEFFVAGLHRKAKEAPDDDDYDDEASYASD